MKHSHIVASLGLLALSFVFITTVSADSTDSTATGSMMTGFVDTGVHHEQRHEDRLNMIETIHQNWKDTIDSNGSSTKALLDASTTIRQEATAACKIAVDQFKAGTLSRDEALTQCKELKKKMEDTIKTMRKDLQTVRKAARESIKETNQSMRKDFKEKYNLGTGNIGSGDMKPPRKEENHMGTGSIGTGDHKPEMKPKEDMPKRPESKLGSGSMGSGDMRSPRKDDRQDSEHMGTRSMSTGDRREMEHRLEIKPERRPGTGEIGTGDMMKGPDTRVLHREDRMGTGVIMPGTGDRHEMKPREDMPKRPEVRMSTGDMVGTGDVRPPRPGTGDIINMIQSLGKSDTESKRDRKPDMKPKEEEKKDTSTTDRVPPVA